MNLLSWEIQILITKNVSRIRAQKRHGNTKLSMSILFSRSQSINGRGMAEPDRYMTKFYWACTPKECTKDMVFFTLSRLRPSLPFLCLLLKISWGNPYLKILDPPNLYVADVHMKKINPKIWSPISIQKLPQRLTLDGNLEQGAHVWSEFGTLH